MFGGRIGATGIYIDLSFYEGDVFEIDDAVFRESALENMFIFSITSRRGLNTVSFDA